MRQREVINLHKVSLGCRSDATLGPADPPGPGGPKCRPGPRKLDIFRDGAESPGCGRGIRRGEPGHSECHLPAGLLGKGLPQVGKGCQVQQPFQGPLTNLATITQMLP